MSFGGHVNDMVNRVKQNAALKNARRKKFKGGNDYSKIEYEKTSYDFPEMTSEEFKKFKNNLIEEAKQEQKKKNAIYTICNCTSNNCWIYHIFTLLKIITLIIYYGNKT